MQVRTQYRGLTLDALRNILAIHPYPPVLYYILSSALSDQGQIIRIANEGAAPLPYDVVFHPDLLLALQTALAGVAVLRPHSNAQWRKNVEHMVASWSPATLAFPTNNLSPAPS